MTDPQKLSSLAGILQCCPPYALRSRGGRRSLSRQISIGTGMYLRRVEEFVEEMAGLDLSLAEERELFIQLAERGL
jgi:hypothetical protein